MGGGPPAFPQDFSCLVVLRIPASPRSLLVQGSYLLWPRFSTRFPFACVSILQVLTPSSIAAGWFGLFRVRSPLLTESHVVFSSWGYLDVSVPPVFPHHTMNSCDDTGVSPTGGFPHSEIRESSVICTYSRLIAACRVLLRLSVPGHPPCALSSLTCLFLDPHNCLCFLILHKSFPSRLRS